MKLEKNENRAINLNINDLEPFTMATVNLIENLHNNKVINHEVIICFRNMSVQILINVKLPARCYTDQFSFLMKDVLTRSKTIIYIKKEKCFPA